MEKSVRILVADPVAEEGVQILRGIADVDVITKQTEQDLIRCIPEYDALVVRSETKVTAPVIEAGVRLRAIGRAGVGVDNIDVDAATRKGITVVNAPTGVAHNLYYVDLRQKAPEGTGCYPALDWLKGTENVTSSDSLSEAFTMVVYKQPGVYQVMLGRHVPGSTAFRNRKAVAVSGIED